MSAKPYKYKAEQYLALFEQAFILKRVFPKGTNVLQEPKVLLAPPYRLLYRDLPDALGGLREDYFAEAMRQRGVDFWYLKTTRGAKTPDFVLGSADLERTVIEIGGRGKKTAQFKDFTTEQRFIFTHSDDDHGLRRPSSCWGCVSKAEIWKAESRNWSRLTTGLWPLSDHKRERKKIPSNRVFSLYF